MSSDESSEKQLDDSTAVYFYVIVNTTNAMFLCYYGDQLLCYPTGSHMFENSDV